MLMLRTVAVRMQKISVFSFVWSSMLPFMIRSQSLKNC